MSITMTIDPASVAPRVRPDQLVIRALDGDDSIDELTSLLHRAYTAQMDAGLHPLAGRQSPEITKRRVDSGECFVAVDDGRLVGTILLGEVESAQFPTHFLEPDVAHFSLFGVDPDVQGMGVGRGLLEAITQRAKELGFDRLACAMAEPDADLMRYYQRHGYEVVDHWQWPYTNYRSAILSREICGD